MIDTHCHLDGEEFAEDLKQVIIRAKEAGVKAIGVPGIDLKSCETVMALCEKYPGFCFPMLGLHPEEVRNDWREVLQIIKFKAQSSSTSEAAKPSAKFKVKVPTALAFSTARASSRSTVRSARSSPSARWEPPAPSAKAAASASPSPRESYDCWSLYFF